MAGYTIFRILADLCHMLSKCILIFAIHRNKSAEGVSFITQALYAVVFCTRYLDLFSTDSAYLVFFKIFYIVTSFYILVVMYWIYPRTREREVAWKMGAIVLGGSVVSAPVVMLIFNSILHKAKTLWATVYDFSLILESVCILPQLLLLRQTTVPTVIDSYYLLTLGAYRGLYLVNWLEEDIEQHKPPIAVKVIFGLVQTALYVDFAWVYYTRQRVKLRNGGVVDADDIRRGWLLHRIFGKHVDTGAPDGDDGFDGEDEESAPALGGGRRNGHAGGRGAGSSRAPRAKWGARGISVSADDGVLPDPSAAHGEGVTDGLVDPDAKMRDPDELARALDEDDDDAPPPAASSTRAEQSGVRNGSEWRD